MSMSEAFARAYKDGQWHNGSGSGSSPANTVLYRTFLQAYLRSNMIRSVVDVGCGDWQFSKLIDWTGVSYFGIDVVPGIVRLNTLHHSRWAGDMMIRFAEMDGLDGPLPDADLVICKDLLQHWPDSAVQKLAGQLAGRRALLTYDLGVWHEDIEPGGYRPLDLGRPPYSWPVRERLRYESVSHEGTVTRVKVVAELAP